MAKAVKKKKELTIEEKLAEALVPVEEQPYQVPENWCWTKVGALSSLHRGVSYKKNDAHTDKQENDCLVMRGGNIGEGYIDIHADNIYIDLRLVNEDQLVKQNDIIIVASTGSTKVIGRAGISFADYSDVAFGAFLMAVRPSKKTAPRYMDFYFQSDLYRNRIRDLASGVNINNIRADYINESPYPLPPLPEQQRIVDRIESLFAKLDEAKEKAQAVVDGFEDRKAAILHKAFTGELTRKWRHEHGIHNIQAQWKPLKDLCIKITDGTHHSPTNESVGDYMYVTAKNIKETGIDLNNITYVSKEVHEEIYSRCDVQYQDVLYIKDGATTGIATVNTIKEPFSLLSSVAVLRANPKYILPHYLAYALNSKDIKTIMLGKMTGVAITRLTLKKIKVSEVPVFSLEEQETIIYYLEKLLEKEQQAKEAAEQVISQIDTMKKSILARAFRGELGTNDTADESAVELLKRIL